MGGSLLLHTRKEEIERVRGMRMYCRKMICYLAFLAFSLLTLSCMCQVVMAQIYGTCQPGYAISSGTLPVDSGTCESKIASLQDIISMLI